MSQMRRVEFPKIILNATKVDREGNPILDDKKRPIREPVKAQALHAMALASAGGAAGYDGLRKHLPISAAIEKAKDGFVLLDEGQWVLLTSALETFKPWPWYHEDVLRVIDAAKNAEKVDVEVKEQGPNRRQRRSKKG